MKKMEKQRGISVYDTNNWQNMKHRDAQLESSSIKEQREKQKILTEKLMSVKEQTEYRLPPNIKNNHYIDQQAGKSSTQRDSLNNRLNDVLACFYVSWAEIPAEPSFQILNKSASSSQPKNIRFDKQTIDNSSNLAFDSKNDKKDMKPLKGILKVTTPEGKARKSESEPRAIDPALFKLLREINANKTNLSREKTELLLKPYKESGELDYLNKNQHLFQNFLRNSTPVPSIETQKIPHLTFPPNNSYQPYTQRNQQPFKPSPSPQNQHSQYPQVPMNQYHQFQYQNQNQGQNNQTPPFYMHSNTGMPPQMNPPPPLPQNQPIQQPINPQPNPQVSSQGNSQSYNSGMMNRNYKTVPCKYFHSPQGCVKGHNCTFIHDEEYAGRPTPSMLKYNRGMNIVQYEQGGQGMMNQGYGQGYMQNQPPPQFYHEKNFNTEK